MRNILNKQLKITCKSDLICGSGESWGNVIDTDVIHDPYGFPFIPARRMKGLIREAFWEMNQFGLVEQKTIESIFGTADSEHHFVLGNAYLKNIAKLQKEVFDFSINEETVLEHYTETRYQTKVDANGIADENSLRSSRAVCKGTEFYADIEFEEEYLDIIQKALKLVTHAGLNRTRGFGEIVVEIVEGTSSNIDISSMNFEDEKEYKVTLQMKNLSPLSIPSVNGMESLDYISGSSLQGFFLNNYLKNHKADDKFYEILENVKFLNAYISDEEFNEYQPVHESLYKEKVGKKYYDKLVVDDENNILKKVNHKYIHGTSIKEVDTEMFYHHRRPEDKSIGHALDNASKDAGLFYQLEVISPNQYFVGHIISKGKYLKPLLESVPSFIKIGASKNVQYGNVHIVHMDPKEWKPAMVSKGQEVICTFIEPVVLLDKKCEAILTQEVLSTQLNVQLEASYIGYTDVGGYNNKWKLQKQSYHAFSKGSCIKGVLLEDMPSELFVGNFVKEGNGFVQVTLAKDFVKAPFESTVEEKQPNPKNIIFTKPIYVDMLKKQVYAKSLGEILSNKEIVKLGPTANGRALKMASKPSIALFLKDVEGIKDKDKKKEILKVYDSVKEICEKKISAAKLSTVTSKAQFIAIQEELILALLREYFVKHKMEGRMKDE